MNLFKVTQARAILVAARNRNLSTFSPASTSAGEKATAKKNEAKDDAGNAIRAAKDSTTGYGQAAKEKLKSTADNVMQETGDQLKYAGQKVKGEETQQPSAIEQVKNAASAAAQKTGEILENVTQKITGKPEDSNVYKK